jgi:hypothetical protein
MGNVLQQRNKYMILEGIARRILKQLELTYQTGPKIDVKVNHQQIGDMIDRIHRDQEEYDNRRRKTHASMDVLKKKLGKRLRSPPR